MRVPQAEEVKTAGGIIINEDIAQHFREAYSGDRNWGTVEAVYPGCKVSPGAKIRFSHNLWGAIRDRKSAHAGREIETNLWLVHEDQELIYWYDGTNYHMAPDKVLVEPIFQSEDEMKVGGLYVQANQGHKQQVGKVMAKGSSWVFDGLEVGDVVFHNIKDRIMVELFDREEKWDVLRERNIMGIAPFISDAEVEDRRLAKTRFEHDNAKLESEYRAIVAKYTGSNFANTEHQHHVKEATSKRKYF